MIEGKIFSAINGVMADLGPIGKDKRNAAQGFQYRGVDDVMNALNPLLVKHRLFCVPEVLEQTRERSQTAKGAPLLYSILKMRYTLVAEDGSQISAVVIGEGMDSGDKASNKAMSVAYKYAMFQIFSIPTEEFKDPDADTPAPVCAPTPAAPPAKPVCSFCGNPIGAVKSPDGRVIDAHGFAALTKEQTGRSLCLPCFNGMHGGG